MHRLLPPTPVRGRPDDFHRLPADRPRRRPARDDRAGHRRLGGLARLDRVSATWAAFSPRGGRSSPSAIAALAEFVTDQLPTTPSRKVPPQFGARAALGRPLRRGARRRRPALVARAGRRHRRRGDRHAAAAPRCAAASPPRFGARPAGRASSRTPPPSSLGADRGVAGMSERFDAIVIGGGQAGPSLAVRLAGAGQTRRDRRAPLPRRHLRQHRLPPDQDADRQRLRRPPRPPRRRLRHRHRPGHGRHGPRQGAGRRASSLEARQGQEDWLRATPDVTLIHGHARLTGPRTRRGRRPRARRRAHLPQRRRPRRGA